MILITVFSILIDVGANLTPNYEMLATNHVLKKSWAQKYSEYKLVEFRSRTDTSFYLGHVFGCRNWDDQEKERIAKGRLENEVSFDWKPEGVKIRPIRKSKRLKLYVGPRIRVENFVIVQIQIYKPKEFVDHYFVILDLDGNVLDMCGFNEII